MQAFDGKSNLYTTATSIYKTEGIRGLYRGGLPLIVGGALMRSAQFGVYESVLSKLRQQHPTIEKIGGVFYPLVILAGFAGGFSRGIVEGPFEFIKVRRQVEQKWKFTEVFSGSGATIFRNSFLFGSFVLYMDLVKTFIPGGLSPFFMGALCSNLAWISIWPLDVTKSLIQSGNYAGKSYGTLLKDVFTNGSLFRGIVPGLARSTIANGFSMVAYKKVEALLKEQRV